MADQVTVQVDTINVTTVQRKDGTGTFEVVDILGDNGQKYKGFRNKIDVLPEVGDTIEITYQAVKSGKYTNNNIVSVKAGSVLNAQTKNNKETELTKVTLNSIKSTTATPMTAQKLYNQQTGTTSKDISMEVSGLLQALIGTGKYTTDKGATQFDALDNALREVLNLKRTVAQELEQNKHV